MVLCTAAELGAAFSFLRLVLHALLLLLLILSCCLWCAAPTVLPHHQNSLGLNPLRRPFHTNIAKPPPSRLHFAPHGKSLHPPKAPQIHLPKAALCIQPIPHVRSMSGCAWDSDCLDNGSSVHIPEEPSCTSLHPRVDPQSTLSYSSIASKSLE
jgi:hypothetical protein